MKNERESNFITRLDIKPFLFLVGVINAGILILDRDTGKAILPVSFGVSATCLVADYAIKRIIKNERSNN
jgi:hypothetical protein